MTSTAEPFTINVSEASLDDLDRRLRATRWPDASVSEGWRFGTDDAYLRELVDYWIEEYDWRRHEAEMNRFANFRATVNGTPVHFIYEKGIHEKGIHEQGQGLDPLPIILTHGWPWSFWDLSEIIEPLTNPAAHGGDPADAFDVVVPSLPGFGFSTPLPVGYMSTHEVSDTWVALMRDVLGYERFCAQGGDWGAIVTADLGRFHPDSVHGIALTMPSFPTPRGGYAPEDLGPGEEHYEERTNIRLKTARSHVAVMGTDPQTLAHALHDSPVGLLSWLVERRRNWSDCEDENGDRDVERRFSKDDLLTLASIYWHTESFWSSARMYYGRFNTDIPRATDADTPISVPTAMAVFPGDLIFMPRKAAERVANIQRWEHMPSGGHFAAAEEPNLVVNEVREFFRQFRS